MLNIISLKCGKNSLVHQCVEMLNEGCNRLLLEFCVDDIGTALIKINDTLYDIDNTCNYIEVPKTLLVAGAKINVLYDSFSFYLQVADETDGDMIVKQNGNNYDVVFFKKSEESNSSGGSPIKDIDGKYVIEFGELIGNGSIYFTRSYKDKPYFHIHTSDGSIGTVTLNKKDGSALGYVGATLSGVNSNTTTLLVFYCIAQNEGDG